MTVLYDLLPSPKPYRTSINILNKPDGPGSYAGDVQRFGRKLHEDLKGAHCLVAHGSNAAVEAVIMGSPVFVHPDSAASLVGRVDLSQIEAPIYPDRQPWLNSLAYSQFSETELVNGVLWKLIT